MNHTTAELVIIILVVACGLMFGIRGLCRKGSDLPEILRSYDLKLAIVQLGVGIIGAVYLVYITLLS
jgi:hypothetical protein